MREHQCFLMILHNWEIEPKTIHGMLFKLWTSCDKTWWMSWVCCRHRSSWFDFGSGPNPDSANQWMLVVCWVTSWRSGEVAHAHYTRVLLWRPCTVSLSFTRAGSMIEIRTWRWLFSISDTKLELFILAGTRSAAYHSGYRSTNITLSQSTLTLNFTTHHPQKKHWAKQLENLTKYIRYKIQSLYCQVRPDQICDLLQVTCKPARTCTMVGLVVTKQSPPPGFLVRRVFGHGHPAG